MRIRVDTTPMDRVADLRRRMYSPLCGLVTAVGYTQRPRQGARAFIADATLCGGYHASGAGFVPFEPEIRVYAEAAERYSAALAGTDDRFETRWASHEEMTAAGLSIVDSVCLDTYEDGARGPFDAFDTRAPMTWVRCPVAGGGEQWVPAHVLFMGYKVRRHDGEPWLQAAFSTGTAVHTSVGAAVEAAALELIQIDSAMGHWYGATPATRILLDERTARLSALLRRYAPADAALLRFYLLHNADLPAFTVACVRQTPGGSVPATAVGLGTDLTLERAMYKAFVEALEVRSLAERSYLKAVADGTELTGTTAMYDVGGNVTYYAARDADVVERHFAGGPAVHAAELGPDAHPGADGLVRAFHDTGKTLVAFDITPADIASLGFVAVRLWCAETLSPAHPSAPPSRHPRFAAYGGFHGADPHPYR